MTFNTFLVLGFITFLFTYTGSKDETYLYEPNQAYYDMFKDRNKIFYDLDNQLLMAERNGGLNVAHSLSDSTLVYINSANYGFRYINLNDIVRYPSNGLLHKDTVIIINAFGYGRLASPSKYDSNSSYTLRAMPIFSRELNLGEITPRKFTAGGRSKDTLVRYAPEIIDSKTLSTYRARIRNPIAFSVNDRFQFDLGRDPIDGKLLYAINKGDSLLIYKLINDNLRQAEWSLDKTLYNTPLLYTAFTLFNEGDELKLLTYESSCLYTVGQDSLIYDDRRYNYEGKSIVYLQNTNEHFWIDNKDYLDAKFFNRLIPFINENIPESWKNY